eukprot:jgi/Phyca11/131857/e_gw1.118.27.1
MKNLRADFDDAAEELAHPAENERGVLPSWPLLWSAQGSLWSQRTKVKFPEVGAAEEDWKQAAHGAPELLLHILRNFRNPHDIIARIPGSAIRILTGRWREQCWAAAVETAAKDEAALPQRKSRLKAWKQRIELVPASDKQQQLRQALMNSTEEWVIEKHEKYGQSSLLRLCAPQRALLLGHYLLCAYVYAEKIAVLLGSILHETDPITLLMDRHLHAIRTRQQYHQRCVDADNKPAIQWGEMGEYMAAILAEDISDVQDQLRDGTLPHQY